MQLIEFPEQTAVFAKDQPEYMPLPAHVDEAGTVTCCWHMTWRERLQVFVSGRIWHQVLTFGNPLQPQLLHSTKPNMGIE